jgi:uncharacterized protein YjbI with pentapeptide repeats
MSDLNYDQNKHAYVLTTEEGTKYAINTYEFTRELERKMDSGCLYNVPVVSELVYRWEELLEYGDFPDTFEIQATNLKDVINSGGNVFKRGDVFEDEDLSYSTLEHLNMGSVTFRHIDFSHSRFDDCDLENVRFENCTFDKWTQFVDCKLYSVNFSGIALSAENFIECRGLNLSGAISQSKTDFLNARFEKNKFGYIAYKSFGFIHPPNPNWKIEENSVLTEVVDYDIHNNCSYGINVETASEVLGYSMLDAPIWKVQIFFEDLADVVVPTYSSGKIRAGRIQLLEVIDKENLRSYPDGEKVW